MCVFDRFWHLLKMFYKFFFNLKEHAHLAAFASLTLVLAGCERALKGLETSDETNQLVECQVHVHPQFSRTLEVGHFELAGQRVTLF